MAAIAQFDGRAMGKKADMASVVQFGTATGT
jgi:hypothetical protein